MIATFSHRRFIWFSILLAITGSVGFADESADSPEPTTLSIAPLDHVEFPKDRPKWIAATDYPQDLFGSAPSDAIEIAVVSPPQPTPGAAAEMMEVMARGMVENYLEQKALSRSANLDVDAIDVEIDWIRDELITRRYDGEVQSGNQTQFESACLLRITPTHQRVLDRLIENHQLMHRLGITGVLAMGGFLSLVGGSILFSGLASRQRVG